MESEILRFKESSEKILERHKMELKKMRDCINDQIPPLNMNEPGEVLRKENERLADHWKSLVGEFEIMVNKLKGETMGFNRIEKLNDLVEMKIQNIKMNIDQPTE